MSVPYDQTLVTYDGEQLTAPPFTPALQTLIAHAPSDIVRWLLVSLQVGADPRAVDPTTFLPSGQWPIYEGSEPDKPDNCLTVYTTQGIDHLRSMDGHLAQHYGFQVRVRSVDSPSGWLKANSIRSQMGAVSTRQVVQVPFPSAARPQVEATYIIHALVRIGQIMKLGTEVPKTKRHLFTINAQTTIHQQ